MTAMAGNTFSNSNKKLISSVSMTLILVSFSMLFATLFLGYFIFRFNAIVWPPMGMERIGLMFPSFSTGIIAFSSISLYLFQREQQPANGKIYFWLTFVLGLGFMGTQLLLWKSLEAQGIFTSTGTFASVIYAFTWIHAAHIVMGLGALLWLLPIVNKNKLDLDSSLRIQNVSKFWHFLGIVWLLMFLGLFVF